VYIKNDAKVLRPQLERKCAEFRFGRNLYGQVSLEGELAVVVTDRFCRQIVSHMNRCTGVSLALGSPERCKQANTHQKDLMGKS
jgi:hypothetical protein